MAKLDKIGVIFLAKLLAISMAVVGMIAGIIYSVGGMIYDLLTVGLNLGTALAFLALVGMPVLFAAGGFLVGAVAAFLYNSVAKLFGGIEIDMEQF
jgi:hypothetical protein